MGQREIVPEDLDDNQLRGKYQGFKKTALDPQKVLDGAIQSLGSERKRDDDRVSLISGRDSRAD